MFVTHLGQWVRFYIEGVDDLAFVLQCLAHFTPSCEHYYHLSLPIQDKCFTVDTYSKCMSPWDPFVSDKVFNQEQMHESKIGYTMPDELIMYSKVTWARDLGWLSMSKLMSTRPKASSEGLAKIGG